MMVVYYYYYYTFGRNNGRAAGGWIADGFFGAAHFLLVVARRSVSQFRPLTVGVATAAAATAGRFAVLLGRRRRLFRLLL